MKSKKIDAEVERVFNETRNVYEENDGGVIFLTTDEEERIKNSIRASFKRIHIYVNKVNR